MWQTFLVNLVAIQAMVTIAWLISLRLRNVAVIDCFWGMGFVLVAWVSMLINDQPVLSSILIAILTTAWGLRLSIYLTWRNWGEPEDRRYAAMRDRRGEAFKWTSYLTVFTLQAVILWFVSLPIQIASLADNSLGWQWLVWTGAFVWLIGFYFETVGDWQLARFKADPGNEGKVLDSGLWRYTRHPNYFGNFCMWWGIYLVSIDAGAVWTILSPLAMAFFLMKVSGVTLLESTITDRRPAYREYKQKTSAFFPAAPKSI